jgi:hypothetical protein
LCARQPPHAFANQLQVVVHSRHYGL